MFMKNFTWLLNSSWFVGIITGIISGIIVYFITSYIIENKKKIEKKKRIAIANDAVLSLLRPHIANSGLPSLPQLEAIVASIARQYEVNASEMNSPKMFCEDLVVEFVGNVYIPAELKLERIKKLLEFIELVNIHANNTSNISEQVQQANSKIKRAGIIAGVFSTTIALLAGIIASGLGMKYFNLIMMLFSICALILSLIIFIYTKRKSHKEELFVRTLNSSRYNNIMLQNCGTSLCEPYSHDFSFIDYFDDGE